MSQYNKTYYERNKDKIIANQLEYHKANRDKQLAYMKIYNKQYYESHKPEPKPRKEKKPKPIKEKKEKKIKPMKTIKLPKPEHFYVTPTYEYPMMIRRGNFTLTFD